MLGNAVECCGMLVECLRNAGGGGGMLWNVGGTVWNVGGMIVECYGFFVSYYYDYYYYYEYEYDYYYSSHPHCVLLRILFVLALLPN